MSKWNIYTPDGFQDLLFDECATKREIEDRIRKLFKSCGYFEVETPTIEYYDVFSSESGMISQETMFKFFDNKGRILVVRPDITIPVARIAATKFKDAPCPLRFSYIGNVFRYNEYGGGKQNEFTQAGVEILGVSTPESDAEVISIAINALKEAGLTDFQVDIGQVEFFNGLVEETEMPDEAVAKMRLLIDRKDYVGVEALLQEFELREDLKQLILDLPSLFGSKDVIDKVEKLTKNEKCLMALENIRQVLDILEDYGHSEYLSVDLGMLRELDYDTGIIFRGFTHNMGFPVLSGGRYDRLVGEFGRDCPATGFSMGIGLILTALQRQKKEMVIPSCDTVMCYSDESARKTAFSLCQELRRQGLAVVMDVSNEGLEAVKRYADENKIGGIINVISDKEVEVINMESGEVRRSKLEDLAKKERSD